jgi:uncharacterized membrane protein YeaQ/YmgE (transglycosylase-associated protein family)
MTLAYITLLIAGPILAPGDLLAWLLVGLIAGFLASTIVRKRGYGCLGNIIVGLVGAAIGGYLAGLLNIQGVYHFWGSVIIAFIGACILVALLQLLSGNAWRS